MNKKKILQKIIDCTFESRRFRTRMKRRAIQRLMNTFGEQDIQQLKRDFYSQSSVDLAKALLGKVLVRKLASGELLRGTIVETEAYPGTEEASRCNVHCFITKNTEKNAGIFMDPGTTWVYLTYGVFNMINISAFGPGSACLLRAIEPKDNCNLDLMQQFRQQKKGKVNAPPPQPFTEESARKTRLFSGLKKAKPSPVATETTSVVCNPIDTSEVSQLKPRFKNYELGNGPGKLCKAFNIDKAMCDQLDLTTSQILWIEENNDLKYKDGNFEIIETTRIGINSAPQSSKKNLFRFYIKDNFSVSTVNPSQIPKKLVQAKQDDPKL